jgi:putative transposase
MRCPTWRRPSRAWWRPRLRKAFIQPDQAQASQTLRHVADQLPQKWPKLAAFIDDSETDVLSHLGFPEQHRSKLHSTNPLER